jgi:predicted anti-sigma-YlaC factor YlaD
MSADAAHHIPGNRIIQMVADGSMRRDAQEHLKQCAPCRDMMAALASDLDQLRQRAEQATPAPQKHFVLPVDRTEHRRIRRRHLGWAAAGTVLSAALLTIFLWGRVDNHPLPGPPPTTSSLAAQKDPEMIKVNLLAESALPEAYLVLSESLDSGYDEGFIDFLIPPLEDDSVS